MKEITDHIVPAGGVPLQIYAIGEPAAGGAHATYEIAGVPGPNLRLQFQQGNPREKVTGITTEALLAIAIDRQRGFQRGPLATPEGARALRHLTNALKALQERTRERIRRGVEGRSVE